MKRKILIRTKEKTFLIGAEEILYCKAAGSYSVIYLQDNREIITSVNLLNLYVKMGCFPLIYRVSQSFLVNMSLIRCIHHGTKEIELSNNFMIPYTLNVKELEQALLLIIANN